MEARADQAPLQSDQPSVPTGWDVFVLLLSILSLINIVLSVVVWRQKVADIILVVDGVLCLVFFGDFLRRLRRALHQPECGTDGVRGRPLQGHLR